MDISELNKCQNPPCSWTSAHVPYYLHVINRAKLERYFFETAKNKRNRNGRNGSNDGSCTPSSSRNSANSRE